jgi:hypothetical protein
MHLFDADAWASPFRKKIPCKNEGILKKNEKHIMINNQMNHGGFNFGWFGHK